MKNADQIKEILTITSVLKHLAFKKGRRDGVYFCPCHPSSKPTVIATDDKGRANCNEPDCKIKRADIFAVIQIVSNCSFDEALQIANRMAQNLRLEPQLAIDSATEDNHALIPTFKPLLKTHSVWLESILGKGVQWAVNTYGVRSWRKSHIAIPIDADEESFVFVPIRTPHDSIFYKGKKRTLQFFPQRPLLTGNARKLILCPGEMEVIALTSELVRRCLTMEWAAVALTNGYRPFDRLEESLKSPRLAQFEEIIIVLYHHNESKAVREALIYGLKRILPNTNIQFWTLPAKVVSRDSFFEFLRCYRDDLPYPLNRAPLDQEHALEVTKVKRNDAVTKRLVDTSLEIYFNSPEHIDYLHSVFCQVSIPRKKTESRVYEHKNGGTSLRIEAGFIYDGKDWIEQPLPYGALPRLILIYISSLAVLKKSPVVEVGNSLSEFMRQIGLPNNGGEHGRGRSFKAQLQALVASRFMIGMTFDHAALTIETKPFHKFLAWLSNTDEQQSLWPGCIELSNEFYESLREHSVPLDPRALGSLKHTSLGIDIYTWMASRLHRLSTNKDLFLDWEQLQAQFGATGMNQQSFSRNFKNAMRAVQLVYPAAKVEEVVDGRGYMLGYKFTNSPSPIGKKDSKLIIC